MLVEGMQRRLSFEEFRKVLAEELILDEQRITPEASFINDLHVDSIRLLEMILRIEALGVEIPAQAAWRIRTVNDAYEYYLNHSNHD